MNRRTLLPATLIVAAAAGVAVWLLVASRGGQNPGQALRVSGNIELIDVELSFKIPGLVAERAVDEGEVVQEGQVVARLDTSDLAAERDMRQAELEAARAALEELLAGSRPEEKEAAKAAMEKAAAALKELQSESARRVAERLKAEAALEAAQVEEARLREEWKTAEKLYSQNAIAKETFDRQRAAYELAVWRRKEAEQQLELTREQTRREQIEQAQKTLQQARAEWLLVEKGPRDEVKQQAAWKLKQAEAALRLAQTRLDYATLRAPFDGLVLAKHVEPGEYVAAGTPVLTVGNMKKVWLRAYVEETDLGRVQLGQPAVVTTDGLPGVAYEGRVSFISDEAEFTPKNVQTRKERVKLVYRIKIDIDNPDMGLKRGMPADAEILLEGPASGGP